MYALYANRVDDLDVLTRLCRQFLEADEPKAALLADCVLQRHHHDSAVLALLCRLRPEQKPVEAVTSLLSMAQRYYDLFALRSTCLIAAGRLCAEHGLFSQARRLSLAVMAAKGYSRARSFLGDSRPSGEIGRYLDDARTLYFSLDTGEVDNFWHASAARAGAFNPLSAGQDEYLLTLLKKYRVESQADRISSTAQNALQFAPDLPRGKQIGNTRFGGLPDVPPGWSWPGPEMEFLAQINLADITPLNRNSVLPPRGLLSFFARNEVYGWEDESSQGKVLFYDGDFSVLQRAEVPESHSLLRAEMPGIHSVHKPSEPFVYDEIWAKPFPVIDLLEYPELSANGHEQAVDGDFPRNEDRFHLDVNGADTSAWQLLGSNPQAFDSDNQNEVLLLAIGSDDLTGMMFSDAGTLYFLIHQDDLLAFGFDRVYLSMTCG